MAADVEADVTNVDWREQWFEASVRLVPETNENRTVTNDDIRNNAKDWHEDAGFGQWTSALADDALAFVRTKGAVRWHKTNARGYFVRLRTTGLGSVREALRK
jgi:hypothetical protein